VVPACNTCGEDNPERARFCSACGTVLADEISRRGEARKTVTVVFADVVDSTRLGAQLDPESLRRVMSRYFETVSQALRHHGGVVEKFIGDAVMAVFGIPAVHEDDALRAVRAVLEMRESVETLNRELEQERGVRIRIRIGVNTGEVVTGDPAVGRTLVTGDAVNIAARLEQAAPPGEVLIGDATRWLVRDAVSVEPMEPLALKGKDDAVLSWRLLEVFDTAPGYARFDSPLIGREGELAQMRQALTRVVEGTTPYLFTLLGPAGIGKSRLTAEFASCVSDTAALLAGRCLPYGDGITFYPLWEMTRELIGDSDDPRSAMVKLLADEEGADLIADRIAAALGRSNVPASAEETFWAVRKLFEALARRRPLVVVFEDIHWGEPMLLDMIEHIADWSRDVPVLLLCLARPELLEKRSDWGGGKLNATAILLEPLTEPDSNALIDQLTGDAGLPDAARLRVAEASEGNPLFVEQMLALLAEDEGLEGGLAIPPTIQALLAARLDRLSGEERAVIERAAVVGKRFWEGAVTDLLPESARATVQMSLRRLVQKELVRPERSVVPGEEGYRFRHLLIRDAAYAGIPKELRGDLHERFALWIERNAGDRVTEIEEILGYHLERSFRYREELGPIDEHARDVAARAGGRLTAAGRRALARGDASAAANLLSRAESLLPVETSGREEVLAELGAALVLAGEFAHAEVVLSEAIEASAAAGNRRLELHALLERAFLRALTEGHVEELGHVAKWAIRELDELGDDLGLAKAWRRIADVSWMRSQWGEQERALEQAIAHAERAGDVREVAGALMRLPMAMYYGPTPVPEAIRRAEEILDRAGSGRVVQSTALVCLAGLHAMSGRFEEAGNLLARGRAISEELGFRVWLAGFSLVSSDIAMLTDDPYAAEEELRCGYRTLEGMGERGLLSMIAGELARVLYAQDRLEEAERFTEVSEKLAGSAGAAPQIAWRAVRARILARRHQLEGSETLGREAVRLAERTDDLNGQGRVLMDLADVLEIARRTGEAVPILERAFGLFEQKGNTVSAAKARQRLTELQGRPTSSMPVTSPWPNEQ
jgi:class 3 adenylate cyclase/tetratricopeptide (TPR) repeat protein